MSHVQGLICGSIDLCLQESDISANRRAKDLWCTLPYPDHPDGCPNYGSKEGCPPDTPFVFDILQEPFRLVGVRFDINKHMRRMKDRHPEWSDRKARCVLYWQNSVDKALREKAEKVASSFEDSKILMKPEAYGVSLFKTCRDAGIELETFPPKKYVWKLALVGKKK